MPAPTNKTTLKVAASNSASDDIAAADFVCGASNAQTTINSALTLGSSDKIEVFLFNGTYNIDAPINLPNGAVLRGNSVNGVQLVCNNITSVLRTSNAATRHEHVLVDSMTIVPGTQNDLACDFRGFTRSQFNRLRVYNFDLGVWFGGDQPTYESCWTNALSHFYLSENLVGVKLSGTDGSGTATANQIMLFEGEVICRDAAGGIGIDVVNGEIVIDTCDIGYGNLSDGVIFRNGVTESRVVNSRFEWPNQNTSKHPITVKSGSYNNFFSGNMYTDGCNEPQLYDENGSNARYIQFDAFQTSTDFPDGYVDLNTDLVFSRIPTFPNGLYIPVTLNSAFGLANASFASVFTVNTNLNITSVANGGAFRLFSDEFSTVKFDLNGSNGRMSLAGDIVASGTAPTIATSAAAGTGATASLAGNNVAGLITLNTGTGPGTGKVLGVTWSLTKPNANYALVLTPANAAAVTGMQRVFVDQAASANTNASINASVALAASTAYKFYYHVISY